MTMKFNQLKSVGFGIAILGGLLGNTSAQAFSLAVVGIDSITSQRVSSSSFSVSGVSVTSASQADSGLGFGALAGISVAPFIEFETGGLYVSRKYKSVLTTLGTPTTNSYSQHALEIPLLLRVNLIPFVSVGAGAYYAIGMGDVSDNNGTKTTTGSYSSFGLKSNDLGLQVSAAVHFPIMIATSLILDARYSYGLTDVNNNPSQTTPAITIKYCAIDVLLGLQFSAF